MNTPTLSHVAKGKRQTSHLKFALKQLTKPDEEIKDRYLYLPAGSHKALRDKYFEMEAEIERLSTEGIRLNLALQKLTELLIECDDLLTDIEKESEWGKHDPNLH